MTDPKNETIAPDEWRKVVDVDEEERGRRRARAAVEEHLRLTQDAVNTLRGLLRDPCGNGPTLTGVLEGWIEAAILRGLVHLDESGFAKAENPAQSQPSDIPTGHPSPHEEFRKRLQFGLKLSFVDHAHLTESIGDSREVEALKTILKLGHVQTFAQARLGAEMVDVPPLLDLAVADLDPAVTCVANRTYLGVARATLAATRPLLNEQVKRNSKLETWQAGLQIAMLQLATSERRGADAVQLVLDSMMLACGELYGNFGKGLPGQLREAARVLRGLEKPDGKGYKVTLRDKPGPTWVRPWGAARKFAKAFGHELPRESEKKRDRTAERAMNTADTDRPHSKKTSRNMGTREVRRINRGDHRPPRGG